MAEHEGHTGTPPGRPLVGRALDVALFVPVGLLNKVHRDLPALVRTGRQRVEQEVVLARFVGKLAVQQGGVELRRRIEQRRQPPPPARVPTPAASSPPAAASSLSHGTVSTPVVRPQSTGALSAVLAIDDYDSLAAAQVVARLPGLSIDQLGAVEQYELAHRRRRTILGRIAQLRTTG
jgi:hypothetical protein